MGNKQRSALEFAVLDWLTLRGGQWFNAAAIAESKAFDAVPWPEGRRIMVMRATLENLADAGLIDRQYPGDYKHPEYTVSY